MEIIPAKKIIWPKVIKALKKGEVIIFPTDTAYGLAADFFSAGAMKKVFLIKERPEEKKVTLITADLKQAQKYFSLNKKELALAKKHWPGPLTLILSLKNSRKKIGVRMPASKIAREIARRFKKPITATSANLSGRANCYSTSCVISQFKNKKNQPALLIDAGRLKKIKPSTVAEVKGEKIKIYREGPVKL